MKHRFVVSILLAAAVFLFASTASGQAVVDLQLRSELSKTSKPVQVIVTFWGDGPPTAGHLDVLNRAGITTGFTFQSLPIAGVLATAAQVDALAAEPAVWSLYFNEKVEYENYEATSLTGVRRLRTDALLTSQNRGLPISGKGVGVVINDSGVDGTHEDVKYGPHLVQNVHGTTNLNAWSSLLPVTYVEGVPNTDVGSGHGTHVAGIVGATGAKSRGKHEGVAPGASLIGYGSGAAVAMLDVLGAFDYAITHQFRYGIRVITNSWGTTRDSGTDFNPADPINVATKKCYDRGIVVVFSAGNSGPGEHTITGNYKKAPWVISVAAGDKSGRLADFSSRGLKGRKRTVAVDGQIWTWEDRPTVTAPGVDIISTRTLGGSLTLLAAEKDAANIEPAYLPFYTHMSGTSMAAPHAAGVVALMLEANPRLSPAQVKQILQETATNMPGNESWEVGAGYINAYAAVLKAADMSKPFGTTVNAFRRFNSNVNTSVTRTAFAIDYNPVASPTGNRYRFTVPAGLTALQAKIDARGVLGVTGNTINLVLIAPDGREYSSGVNLLFPLFTDRTVAVVSPASGNWIVELRGLRGTAANPTHGAALPERVNGLVTLVKENGFSGLNDIAGHPAEASIKLAVIERLVDGYSDGTYKPEKVLKRIELADYLMMGEAIRQYLPASGMRSFADVKSRQLLLVESVTARGAALRDRFHAFRGVMLPAQNGTFSPNGEVKRVDVAYSTVQSLGLEKEALARVGTQVTVQYQDQRIPIDDASAIPPGFEGYVQLALDLNLINAFFSLQQGPFDLKPTIRATFKPLADVTRGEFAVIVTRTFGQWMSPSFASASANTEIATEPVVSGAPVEFHLAQNYPNPFNPSTQLRYQLPSDAHVSIKVFDLLGREMALVVDGVQSAGYHSVVFDAGNLAGGVYFYRIDVREMSGNHYSKTNKMVLAK